MQAYQSVPCLYCGATWNPPGAQTCAKCHNPLAAAQPVYAASLLFLVQRSANRFQAAAHPELGPSPTGMAGRYTWGEIVALIVGCILTLGLFSADLLPA